jgi:acetyl-CoA carboxylase carboxyl transferase subunit alpha
VVIGEGGSGGALALGVTNRILMLQYSIYSVITPEGCASILWRDGAKAPRAAEVMHLQAEDILELKVADEVVPEPGGGAHRRFGPTAEALGEALGRHLDQLTALSPEQLLQQRYDKYRAMGVFLEG